MVRAARKSNVGNVGGWFNVEDDFDTQLVLFNNDLSQSSTVTITFEPLGGGSTFSYEVTLAADTTTGLSFDAIFADLGVSTTKGSFTLENSGTPYFMEPVGTGLSAFAAEAAASVE